MKVSRAVFRTALNKCKINEKVMRRDNMVKNFPNKRYKEFWKEASKLNSYNNFNASTTSKIIDGECDPNRICSMFSNKYIDFEFHQCIKQIK